MDKAFSNAGCLRALEGQTSLFFGKVTQIENFHRSFMKNLCIGL